MCDGVLWCGVLCFAMFYAHDAALSIELSKFAGSKSKHRFKYTRIISRTHAGFATPAGTAKEVSSQLEASYDPFGTELHFGMRVRIGPVQRVVQDRSPVENRSTALHAANHPQIHWWV